MKMIVRGGQKVEFWWSELWIGEFGGVGSSSSEDFLVVEGIRSFWGGSELLVSDVVIRGSSGSKICKSISMYISCLVYEEEGEDNWSLVNASVDLSMRCDVIAGVFSKVVNTEEAGEFLVSGQLRFFCTRYIFLDLALNLVRFVLLFFPSVNGFSRFKGGQCLRLEGEDNSDRFWIKWEEK